jgi:hypothetical protein
LRQNMCIHKKANKLTNYRKVCYMKNYLM